MTDSVTQSALDMLKPENQIPHIKLDVSAKVVDNKLAVKATVPYKFNIGGSPVVHVKSAGLSLCGKKDSKSRGLSVISWERNGKRGEFVSLKLAVNREDHNDLYKMCKGMLETFVQKNDPITSSMWWQRKFPRIEDGTDVHKTTSGFQNMNEFCQMEGGSSDAFKSPASTFGKFLYSESEDEAKWYLDLLVPRESDKRENLERIVLYDERGKMIGNRQDADGNEVYSKGGILLTNKKKLRDLVESSFYKETIWKCDTFVRIYGMDIIHSTTCENVYPFFKTSVYGDIKLQMSNKKQDPNQLSGDQVQSMFASVLFEGVSAPSRKKRKLSKPKKIVLKQDKIEVESISGSDVEGDEEE